MTDRPIIFSAPMIRALLAGTKTQTRRLLKPAPRTFEVDGKPCEVALEYSEGEPWPRLRLGRVIASQEVRYRPGLRLWVREACWTEYRGKDGDGVLYPADGEWRRVGDTAEAREAWQRLDCYASSRHPDNDTASGQRVPSIHMPRWASRLTLTVTDVRAQRVQDISAADAEAEGAGHAAGLTGGQAREAFALLWDSIHGAGAWDANPCVVALTFTVERRNIDHG